MRGRNTECRSGCRSFWGSSGGSSARSGGLVVAVGVGDQFAEEFAGCCVCDPDLEVLDEQDDAGPAWVSSDADADADVVGSAVVPQGDRSGFVDAVVPDRSWVTGSVAGPGRALGMES